MNTCLLCGRPVCARGLCKPHYYQLRKTQQLASYKVKPERPVKDRLLAKIRKLPSGCWEWTGLLNYYGYGQIWLNRKSCRAHRVSYEIFHGPLADGDIVCHRCDNPPCVNPDHLFKGTKLDNNRDAKRKDRNARGERNGHTRLTPEDIQRIRNFSPDFPQSALAAHYGVSQSAISRIRNNKRWTHL